MQYEVLKEKKMERKIVKKIGNLEMDDKGIVYKTGKGGFKAPALPDKYKIPYPKVQPGEQSVCGIYPSEVELISEVDNIDQMNALKELHYQEGLRAGYRELDKKYKQQERKRIARASFAFIVKAFRRCRENQR